MRPVVRYALVAVLTIGLGAVAVYYARQRIEATDAAPTAPPLATSWPYATEQEWIVAQVVRAIADMAGSLPRRSRRSPGV